MSGEWTTEALALRVLKMLYNMEVALREECVWTNKVALHRDDFRDMLGKRQGEVLEYARAMGWIATLAPGSSYYAMTEEGRTTAAGVTVIGPTEEAP